MVSVRIDLSSFPSEKQEELRQKILALAWDNYIAVGHPEILTVMWSYKEPIDSVFPELSPYLTYQ